MEDDRIFQESSELKNEWLAEVKLQLPAGTRVRVICSDVDAYVGALGTVADYDIGTVGDWPLVGVKFDAVINGEARDGFYDDELEKVV